MDAKANTSRDLFDGKVIYEIPPFQRPYVWTEEDQWQPLWEDIERVAESLWLARNDPEARERIPPHFLGAVVLKQLESAAGYPLRWSVIDGQQRLTTLQILLDAAQIAVHEHGSAEDAETLEELVVNPSSRFAGTHHRFKLWPAKADRSAFEAVMDNQLEVHRTLEDSRIAQAHRFFRTTITEWVREFDDSERAPRLAAVTEALEAYLQIVGITLGANDDDQLIFETLNDRGTPLLAADLIKNFVFERCDRLGVDTDGWVDAYWQDFDGNWWREEVSQGRHFRSRIDLFLQYWLTMRTVAEVPTDAVFGRFKAFAERRLADRDQADAFLRGLRRDADTFRDLAELDPTSVSGAFYARVVEALELGALIPLLLWLISDNHAPPREQVDKALSALESWAVRRTLLRRTMKDVNKMVVSLLQAVSAQPLDRVGDVTEDFLREQTAEAREWPTDDQVRAELPNVRVYGNIKQQRLRTIMGVIESRARSARHESVALPTRLELEHVMPRGWRIHWDDGTGANPQAATARDRLINTIGNLTLVTQKLNAALSNRPWTDAEAATVAPNGRDGGLGKRSLLGRFSLLVLNKDIVDRYVDRWTEDDIRARSRAIADQVIATWAR